MYTAKQNDGSNKKDFLVFDTLSDLRDAKNLRIGAQVQLNGYDAVGDFGDPLKGTYGLTGGFSADINDGNFGTDVGTSGDLSYPVDGGYFNYSPNPEKKINAKWFGAKGNGFVPHDQSGSRVTDDRPALQSAINYINSEYAKSRKLFLPRGSYNILSSITVDGLEVGLCLAWRNGFNNDPTAAAPGVDPGYVIHGIRIYGEGNELASAGTNEIGTLIIYANTTTTIDAVCYVSASTSGYTGFEDLAIHGTIWGTLGLNRLNATMSANDLDTIYGLGSEVILGNECKAHYNYLNSASGRTPKRFYSRVSCAGSLDYGMDFGRGFLLNIQDVTVSQCWGSGIKVDCDTSLRMERCLVTYYIQKAYHLTGLLYYSVMRDCVHEQFLHPDNPDFNPYDAAVIADPTNANYAPYYHLPSYTAEDWINDDAVGTGVYVDSASAVLTLDNHGSEGCRRFLYSNQTGVSIMLVNCQPSINGGTRSYFETKGELTASIAAPSKGADVTFNVNFDPSTDLSVGDFVFVGKRTASQYTDWGAKYLETDNFVNWNTNDTVYGHWFRVKTTAATSFVATRMNGTGNFWTFQSTAAKWPGGVTDFQIGDHVALVVRDSYGFMRLTPGTGTNRFNSSSLYFNGLETIGNVAETNSTQNPRFTDEILEGATAFDEVKFEHCRINKLLGDDENVLYYQEQIRDVTDAVFASATLFQVNERNILDDYDTTVEVDAKLNAFRTNSTIGVTLDGANGYGTFASATNFLQNGNALTYVFNSNLAQQTTRQVVYCKSDLTTTAQSSVEIYVPENTTSLKVLLRQATNSNAYYGYTFTNVFDGTWKNIAVIIDDSGANPSVSAYANGVALSGSVTEAETGSFDDSTATNVTIGRQGSGSGLYVIASLNGIYIYSSALSAATILSKYESGDWYGDGTGLVCALKVDEGVGYLSLDDSSNNNDLLWVASGVSWKSPKFAGIIRDFNLDANGAAAYVLSSSRDTLPADAIVTRVLVKNNDAGNITAGNFDINRYDGTNRATIGDNGAQIDAGDSFVIYPNATQDTADRRIEIPNNADAGMDDFDIIVQYEIIG